MPSFEDLADANIQACMATFGETVIYTPDGGSPTSITAIFDKKSILIGDDGLPVMSKVPTLGVRLADLGDDFEPSHDDSVVIRGVTYTVKEIDDDGKGCAHLHLKATT